MKRTLTFVCWTLALIICLTACGKAEDPQPAGDPSAEQDPVAAGYDDRIAILTENTKTAELPQEGDELVVAAAMPLHPGVAVGYPALMEEEIEDGQDIIYFTSVTQPYYPSILQAHSYRTERDNYFRE